jgi:hypothetical protein
MGMSTGVKEEDKEMKHPEAVFLRFVVGEVFTEFLFPNGFKFFDCVSV